MEVFLTPSNITFALGIIAIIFTIYNYFRNPQEAIEKKQLANKFEHQALEKEADSKAIALAQQVEWQKEATDKRFCEMQTSATTAMTLAQNHIHTVDTKVTAIGEQVNNLSKEVVKLGTIIEERIPKKN